MRKQERSLPTADTDGVVNPEARDWPFHSLGDFEQVNPNADTCGSSGAKQSLDNLERWLFRRNALDY